MTEPIRRSDGSDGSDVAEDDAYELPEIVPATNEPDSPRLPDRAEPAGNGATNGASGRADDLAEAPIVPPPVPAPLTPPATTPAPTPAAVPNAEPTARATAWGDHMPATSTVTATPGTSQLRAPGRRPRVRRVTRVLRHIDPWSTFKVALLFSAVGYVVALTSGVLLWRVADSTGTLDNVERWFTQFGWETFELKGGEVFHDAWIIGLFGVVAATGAAVLLVTLFNLVSDIVGGIRMTVLEEEVVERTISSTRRYVVRTPPTDATSGRSPASAGWSVDDDDDRTDETIDDDVAHSGADTVPADPAVANGHDDGRNDGWNDHQDDTAEIRTTATEPTRQQPAADWSVD